ERECIIRYRPRPLIASLLQARPRPRAQARAQAQAQAQARARARTRTPTRTQRSARSPTLVRPPHRLLPVLALQPPDREVPAAHRLEVLDEQVVDRRAAGRAHE